MAVWYMVKRLDTGAICGHDTWRYGTYTGRESIGDVETQQRNGIVHHLIAYVDARDEADAMFMAETVFGLWHERKQEAA